MQQSSCCSSAAPWSVLTTFCCGMLQAAAQQYKELIMQPPYWQRVDAAVSVATPILQLLRLSDRDVPSMGKVHYYAAKVRAPQYSAVSAQHTAVSTAQHYPHVCCG